MSSIQNQIMKFRLPRLKFMQEIHEIIDREIEDQEIEVLRLNQKHLKQYHEVCQIIEKQGLPDYLALVKLPGKLGHGIFLRADAHPLPSGTIIAPYAGELSIAPQNDPDDSAYSFAPVSDILLNKEEQTKFDPKRRFHPRRIYALNLDAEKNGNFTRFINHSVQPNIEAELFKVPAKNAYGFKQFPVEVVYKTCEKVMPGEQLLVCYEDEEESYWKPFGIKPFPMSPQTFIVDKNLKLIETE